MLIDEVKTELRISHDKLDADISRHISACAAELKRVGIAVPDDVSDITETPLLVIAVMLWCKAQFDYLGRGEEFQKGFERLRDSLALSGDYTEGTNV